MSTSMRLSRRLRWAVPAGAVTLTVGLLAGSLISAAQATPSLPTRTPAQLLAAVAGRTGPLPALTGTIVETADLGLPDLPSAGDPTSLQSLVAGSHTIRVWYADPRHLRLAIPGQLSETDLIRNGQDVWTWSSVRNTATHYRLASAGLPGAAAPGVAVPGPEPGEVPSVPTPQQAAAQALAAVGPTTSVSVASNVTVAGQACYELVLAPKDSRSLIGQVRIAIDATRDVPLRVQVFARGSTAPAFQTGFTSISFTQPAAANFAFTRPAGATVVQGSLPANLPPRVMAGGHPRTRQVFKRPGTAKAAGGPAGTAKAAGGPAGTVVGQGWLAVAVLATPSAAPAASGPGLLIPGQLMPGRPAPGRRILRRLIPGRPIPGRPMSQAYSSTQVVGPAPGGSGVVGPVLGPLLGATSQVQGSWGSGRLLRTKLLSVLFTSDGRMLIGAVTPDVLYAAAAKTSGLASQAGR